MRTPGIQRLSVAFLWFCAGPHLPAQAQPHEAYAPLSGVRLFYIDAGGNGVPVVFLHANTGSSRVWEYQIPAFAAAGYRVIAYERRGWARTVREPNASPGTGAGDLLALLD